MAFAETPDNLWIWYDVSGAGTQSVLLIAGQAMSHDMWRPSAQVLGADRRVVCYDHRGVGASESRFPTGWSTRDSARDAVAVLDAAGVERAHVIGHSMGGRIAQWLAADFPERVDALVLSATSVGDPEGVVRAPEATKALLTDDPHVLLPMMASPAWLAEHAEQGPSMLSQPQDTHARRAHFGASATHDGSSALPLIAAPTLVLHGEDDALCPVGNARILLDRIRDARLHVVPKGRHMFLAEFPETLQVVIDFLDEVGATTTMAPPAV